MKILKTIVTDADIYFVKKSDKKHWRDLFAEARSANKPYILFDHEYGGVHIYLSDVYLDPLPRPGTTMELLRGLAVLTCLPRTTNQKDRDWPAPIGAADKNGYIVWVKFLRYQGTGLKTAHRDIAAESSGDSLNL